MGEMPKAGHWGETKSLSSGCSTPQEVDRTQKGAVGLEYTVTSSTTHTQTCTQADLLTLNLSQYLLRHLLGKR